MISSSKRHVGRLLSLSAGLAGVVALELMRGPFFVPDAPHVSSSVDDVTESSREAAVEKPDITTFDEVVARPLFTASRRPPPPRPSSEMVVGPPEPAPKPEIPDLIGVIISADRRMALLRPRATTEALLAMEGQTVAGWQVRAIKPTQVVLGWGNDSEVLKISDAGENSAISDTLLPDKVTLPVRRPKTRGTR
jgi:hypothetical protein